MAQPAEPEPMAGDTRDGAAAPTLAASSIRQFAPILLPNRSSRDGDLARRGGLRSRSGRRQDLDPYPRCQQGGEPGAVTHRAKARNRRRQDDGDGHADRVADDQRFAPRAERSLLPRLLAYNTRHYDQGPAARSVAERSEQLLPRARARPKRHAR